MKAATLSGLLGDDERLRVVAAIVLGARTIDDVARAGELAPQDVRRALPRLISAGVVAQEDGLRVDTELFREAARDRPPRQRELPGATAEQARVLRNFVEDGLLKALPVRAAQRRVVLEYLAERFEPGVDYPRRTSTSCSSSFTTTTRRCGATSSTRASSRAAPVATAAPDRPGLSYEFEARSSTTTGISRSVLLW
jgi:hypothetical protein